MKAELRKIEGKWAIVINREDGTTNVYRYNSKREALKWAAEVGIKF